MDERELRYPERVAVARLHALLELLPTALDKRMQPAGLTSFEFTLLEALAETDDGTLRLSALASRTNATLARLSRVVTGLERKGLVRRAPCAEDARATNAVLTDQGREVYRESTPLYADAVSSMILDGLTEGDVDDLARLAYAILTRLDPDRRLAVTSGAGSVSGSAGVPTVGRSTAVVPTSDAPADDCPADPAPAAPTGKVPTAEAPAVGIPAAVVSTSDAPADDCPADPAPAASASDAPADDCPADPAPVPPASTEEALAHTGSAPWASADERPAQPAPGSAPRASAGERRAAPADLAADARPSGSVASVDLASVDLASVDPEQLAAEACPADPAPSHP
ncbi:MarR family winged helix-turn-helix transcriptional regulator [Promicromonospora sp. NPDC019610]|uniref:MarR family winged helix-turn-helix transcriptional regulator n=1 Tax=Promicromonospora sp. NPDC019610 TaxID=3364405 RepID=UPI0037AB01DA